MGLSVRKSGVLTHRFLFFDTSVVFFRGADTLYYTISFQNIRILTSNLIIYIYKHLLTIINIQVLIIFFEMNNIK